MAGADCGADQEAGVAAEVSRGGPLVPSVCGGRLNALQPPPKIGTVVNGTYLNQQAFGNL